MTRTDAVEKIPGIYRGLVKWRERRAEWEWQFHGFQFSACCCYVWERLCVCVYFRLNPCIFTLCSQRRGWLWVCILKKLAERWCPPLDRNGTTQAGPYCPHEAAQNTPTNRCFKLITQVHKCKVWMRQLLQQCSLFKCPSKDTYPPETPVRHSAVWRH